MKYKKKWKLPRKENRRGTIIISARNTFLDKEVAKYTFPVNPKRAMGGWYSRFWKFARLSLANMEKIDKNFIRATITFESVRTDRAIITMPSGFSANTPFELEPIDLDIIRLHLKAYGLAKFGYPTLAKQSKRQHKRHLVA